MLPTLKVFVATGQKVTFADKIDPNMDAAATDSEELRLLMQAAQRGDSDAYSELLGRITPRIRRVAQRQRGFAGVEEVEDVVQEVLLSVHQVRATYDPARPFVPWLMAIVRRRLADGARRYARTGGREVEFEPDDVTFSELATNSDMEASKDADTLHEAVSDLPDGQRTAIELLKLRELSLKEAAAITGSSESSLKVATHRAISTLRKTLAGK